MLPTHTYPIAITCAVTPMAGVAELELGVQACCCSDALAEPWRRAC